MRGPQNVGGQQGGVPPHRPLLAQASAPGSPGKGYSAAWAGALAMISLQSMGLAPVVAAWAGMATILGIRLIAMAFRITLPTYSARK